MVIAPSGKRRVMEAQSFTEPTMQSGQDASPLNFGDTSNMPMLDNQNPEMNAYNLDMAQDAIDSEMEEQQPEVDDSKVDGDLTMFVFKKLTELGFEPRRLQDYKSKMSQTSIDRDGNETVDVVIPNKAPNGGKIDKDKFVRPLIRDIQRQFGLHFDGAQEADDNWTAKFTSVAPEPEGQTDATQDVLDRAYGKASDKSDSPGDSASRHANTIYELIKNGKDELANSVLKLIKV